MICLGFKCHYKRHLDGQNFHYNGSSVFEKILHGHLDEINQTLHRMKHFIEKPIEKRKEERIMSNFVGIDHVQLAAPKGSEEKARLFFGGILGMEEIPKPSNLVKRGGVWFQCGHHQLHIGIQDHFQAAKKAHPAFLVKSLSELKKALLNHHISIREDEPLEGAIRFYVEDPFGNRIEFLERTD